MGKQLEFTKIEQGIITESIKSLGEILLRKMDEGVERPALEGNMDVENEDRVVKFEIIAEKK